MLSNKHFYWLLTSLAQDTQLSDHRGRAQPSKLRCADPYLYILTRQYEEGLTFSAT